MAGWMVGAIRLSTELYKKLWHISETTVETSTMAHVPRTVAISLTFICVSNITVESQKIFSIYFSLAIHCTFHNP